MKDKLTKELASLEKDICRLLKSLKRDIGDEYRCTDDPDDDKPGMCVTIGFSYKPDPNADSTWNYQTGDNSFTGGAYGHPDWAVIYLYRRSNCRELARQACDELADLVSQ